jgi:hypothetical protein
MTNTAMMTSGFKFDTSPQMAIQYLDEREADTMRPVGDCPTHPQVQVLQFMFSTGPYQWLSPSLISWRSSFSFSSGFRILVHDTMAILID